jgi:uncharacterized protein YciI
MYYIVILVISTSGEIRQIRATKPPDGLNQAEAQKRLAPYGPNEIEEKNQTAAEKTSMTELD